MSAPCLASIFEHKVVCSFVESCPCNTSATPCVCRICLPRGAMLAVRYATDVLKEVGLVSSADHMRTAPYADLYSDLWSGGRRRAAAAAGTARLLEGRADSCAHPVLRCLRAARRSKCAITSKRLAFGVL